jgi:hypothetical protein
MRERHPFQSRASEEAVFSTDRDRSLTVAARINGSPAQTRSERTF